MIEINPTPFKKTEYMKGKITLGFDGIDKTEWNFVLAKSVNGSTAYTVEVDKAEIEAAMPDAVSNGVEYTEAQREWEVLMIASTIRATVLANVQKDKINYNAQSQA